MFSVDELNISQKFHGVLTANNQKSVVKEGTLWLLFKILQVLYWLAQFVLPLKSRL